MKWWKAVLAVQLLLGATALADDAAQDGRIKDLEEENKGLRARVERLEAKDGEQGTDDDADLEEEIEDYTEGEDGLGLNIVINKGTVRGALQFFGDVGFVYTDPARAGRGNGSFFNGSLDIFFTARIGDHFSVLSETVFQTKVGSGNAPDSSRFDQERLWAAWAFSDAIQIKFGLEHGPISLWNRLFHHGHWLELTVTRPLLATFESNGIIPMHEAGFEVFGNIPMTKGALHYVLFVSNGRDNTPARVQEFSDRNNDKAITLGGGYTFDAPQTIFVALFVRTDRIPGDPTTANRAMDFREWIVTFQFQFQSDTIDIISEFAYIYQDDVNVSRSFSHYSAYFQFGYHIGDQWTPYVRLDFRDMDQGAPYFVGLNRDLDVLDLILGLRWDFISNAALKVEIGFGEREVRDPNSSVVSDQGYIRIGIQVAFVF